MANPGYVYVLMNLSMGGLVKVGKTNRDPTTRAAELASATGVPTPFTLVYSSYFNDCTQAERFAHASLESKGYRLSANKEFFTAPVQEAINAVLEARKIDGVVVEPDEEQPNSEDLAEELYKQAEGYFNGSGDFLQDYEKAYRLYEQSSNLGNGFASASLGSMHEFGQGRPENSGKALEFYEKCVNQGEPYGYTEMAEIYLKRGHIINFQKCWRKLFESKHFQGSLWLYYYWAVDYLRIVTEHNLPIEHLATLKQLRDPILKCITEKIESYNKEGRDGNLWWGNERLLVLKLLFDNE